MTFSQLIVLVVGCAAIAWINWYFFRAPRRLATAQAGAGGLQEVAIAVRGGYDPGEVRVRAGAPARLVFDRQETNPCSEEVVIPELGVRQTLPPDRRTAVEVPALRPGRYEIFCGMNMLHGTLVAE